MFNRIRAVILLVSDMKESMKFYKDVLGMEVLQQIEHWVEFSKQRTVLALHPTNDKKKLTKNISMLIGFNVNALHRNHNIRNHGGPQHSPHNPSHNENCLLYCLDVICHEGSV